MTGQILSSFHFILITLFITTLSCINNASNDPSVKVEEETKIFSSEDSLRNMFKEHPEYISTSFDFPVGKPDAKGYYNAQPFGKNYHLGDDWNGVGGGNTDKGDPVYSIAPGYVSKAINYFGGWGKVVTVVHGYMKGDSLVLKESLYAHLDTMIVHKGDWITKGQEVGKIGTADGIYLAHLHLEIRQEPGMQLGPGYSSDPKGYLDPTMFIKKHRIVNAHE